MDAENPSIGPPQEVNDHYLTLPLDKRLNYLTELLESENLSDYKRNLRQDLEIENSDAFNLVLKSFSSSIKKSNWDMLTTGLFKTFSKGKNHRHYAMKLFLMYEEKEIVSPFLMNQAFEAIKIIDVPDDCQDFHSNFLDVFKQSSIEDL
jgi:hypothetical protein